MQYNVLEVLYCNASIEYSLQAQAKNLLKLCWPLQDFSS